MSLFGTDGVRAPYGHFPMTEDALAALGRGLAVFAEEQGWPAAAVIGRDTRPSGASLQAALTRGLMAGGCHVTDLGVLPTPAVQHETARQPGFGAVLTASHNPAHHNGVKVFLPDGWKLNDSQAAGLERAWRAALDKSTAPAAAGSGTQSEAAAAARARYQARILALFPGQPLAGLRLVLDAANGAAHGLAHDVLEALGAELHSVGDGDGAHINDGCGAVHPERAAESVRSGRGALAICLDGDGDRLQLIDETGELVDGDRVLGLMALDARRRGALPGPGVVGTVMSNAGLVSSLAAAGIELVRTPVGDRHVVAEMKARGWELGGESSGHLIALSQGPGDGLLAGLLVLMARARSGRTLAELAGQIELFPSAKRSLLVRSKPPIGEVPELVAAMERVSAQQATVGGRVLVRYSGTEARIRLMVEGPDRALAAEGLEELVAAVHEAGLVAD